MTRYQLTCLPALTLAQYAGSVAALADVGAVVGPMFGRLLGSMSRLGLDPDQPTVAWYCCADTGTDLGVGVPVDEGFDPGDTGLELGELPAVPRAVVVRHEGTLDGLTGAWQELHQYLDAEGLHHVGPSREIYLAGDVTREDSWVIDLQQPVQ